MKVSEIKAILNSDDYEWDNPPIFIGKGICYARCIDHIWTKRGKTYVHWHTPATLQAIWEDGRTFHTPNRTCLIETFAHWAEKLENEDD